MIRESSLPWSPIGFTVTNNRRLLPSRKKIASSKPTSNQLTRFTDVKRYRLAVFECVLTWPPMPQIFVILATLHSLVRCDWDESPEERTMTYNLKLDSRFILIANVERM